MLTLVLLIFWAPGRVRAGRGRPTWNVRGDWWRWLGAVWSLLLLINTNYLNAAALIAVLPLMFLDRRYRQPRQYVLLALLLVAAALDGLWIATTVKPWTATYEGGMNTLFAPPPIPDRWTRFFWNVPWFLRDLGTHEFVPWLALLALGVPFLWSAAIAKLPSPSGRGAGGEGTRAPGKNQSRQVRSRTALTLTLSRRARGLATPYSKALAGAAWRSRR